VRRRSAKQNSRIASELGDLAGLTPAQLKLRWLESESSPPPLVSHPLLHRLLAQRLQERCYGELSSAVVKELERAISGTPPVVAPRPAPALTPGARLIREWNGQTIAVEVLESGFAWKDRTWRSLSEIAREVTGTRWSGPRFFGINARG
jgi:hypothetical protein